MSENKFNKHDKVKRDIEGRRLTVGKHYYVYGVDGDNIQIINDTGNLEHFGYWGFSLVSKADKSNTDEDRAEFRNFRAGDSVRCINNEGVETELTRAKVYEVDAPDNLPELVWVKDDKGKSRLFKKARFILTADFGTYAGDLFEHKGHVSELEMLIQRANLGQHAKSLLAVKYPGQIEYYNMTNNKRVCDVKNETPLRLRVKENKKFTVDNYDCVIDGDTVKVGCRKYKISTLKLALKVLIDEKSYWIRKDGHLFVSVRTGIRENKEKISWEAAQKLLEEIS